MFRIRPGPSPSATISLMRRRTPAQTGFSNSDIRITDEFGNINDVTVSGNFLIGAGFNFEVAAPNANYTISNVSFTNNDDRIRSGTPNITPAQTNMATVTGIRTVDFSNPTDFNPRPRGLCRGWPSNADCGLRDRGWGRRNRDGADDAAGKRLCVGASGCGGLGRNEFCRRFRASKFCSAVRARTF